MRKMILALTGALLVCVVAWGPAALAAGSKVSRPKCPLPKHEQIVAADVQAIVYQAAPPSEEPLEGVYGCAYSSKKSYLLGPTYGGGPSGSAGVHPIALTGSVVAFGIGHSLELGHFVKEVCVRNLRTGKVLHRVPNGSPAEPGDVGIGETAAIVVKTDGSVAWIARASAALGSIEVRSVDETGSHLLAASPEIDPSSLALAGSTLYWTQGGKPHLATLR